MFGLLNLYKPSGLTSRDAVNQVQRLVRPSKVGHAGTLDPIATGVLVICIGHATKLIEHVQRMPKRYRATFMLGRHSPSDDIELEAQLLNNPPVPTLTQIEAALPQFVGEIKQIPPVYSAIKVNGKKAYDLARAGEAPELSPRSVSIFEIAVEQYEYPELVLDMRCGSGTYVRSLGRDLAKSLGTAAVMSALERTEIGPFHVDQGIDPTSLSQETLPKTLLPASCAVADLPSLIVSEDEVEELRHGRFLTRPDAPTGKELAALDTAGGLVALLKPRGGDRFQPVRVFV